MKARVVGRKRANIQYRAKEKDGAVKCWHTACDLQD